MALIPILWITIAAVEVLGSILVWREGFLAPGCENFFPISQPVRNQSLN